MAKKSTAISTRKAAPFAFVCKPNTKNWLKQRDKGITASDAAAAVGLSDWETPAEVWHRKRGNLPPKEQNSAMRLGHKLEPVIVSEFQELTGLEVQYPLGLYRSVSKTFAMATLDARVGDSFNRIVECKSLSWRVASVLGAEGTDEIPTEWIVQTQLQMFVVGAEICDVAALLDGRTLKCYQVKRNDTFIAELLESLAEFWEMVQSGTCPEMDYGHESTADLLKILYPNVNAGESIDLDPDIAAKWELAESCKAIAKENTKKAEELTNEVKAAIGHAEIAYFPDGIHRIQRKVISGCHVEFDREPYVRLYHGKIKKG